MTDPSLEVDAERRARLQRRWLWCAVIVGIACRAVQFAANPSFWCDESALVLNVLRQPAGTLPRVRLDAIPGLVQAGPPGFLLLLKLIATTIGSSEWMARLPAFLASVAAIPLFAMLCARLLSPASALWAAALFAISDRLTYQAGQVKPYSGDVLCAVLLAYVALVPRASAHRRAACAAVVAAVAFWFSYASVLVVTAILIGLAVSAARASPAPLTPAAERPATRKRWREGAVLAASLGALAASVGCVYFMTIRAQHSPMLNRYWDSQFLPWTAPLQAVLWPAEQTWEAFRFSYRPVGFLLVIPAALGLRHLWAQNREVVRICVALLLVALAAGALHQYPFGGGRLSLYLSPFIFLATGAGLGMPAVTWKPAARGAVRIGGAGLVLVGVAYAAIAVVRPHVESNSRELYAFLRAHRQPGEPVYVMGLGSYDQPLYAPEVNPSDDPQVHLSTRFETKPRDPRGFWIVFSDQPDMKKKERAQSRVQPGFRADASRLLEVPGGYAAFFAAKSE